MIVNFENIYFKNPKNLLLLVVNKKYEQLWNTHPSYFVVENFDAFSQSEGWIQKSAKVFEIIEKFLLSED